MDSVQTQTDDDEANRGTEELSSEGPRTARALSNPRPNGFAPWTLDTPPDRRLGLAYCEAIAFGRSLADIEQDPGLPPRDLFLLWIMKDAELAMAFAHAREMSAYTLEDEALHILRQKTREAKTMVELRAVDLLVQQIRWSAAKRNSQVFSDKAAVNVTVPIQINTSLDMGAASAANSTKEFPNIYELKAEHVVEDAKPSDTPLAPEREAPAGVRDLPAKPRKPRGGNSHKRKRVLQPRAALTLADREAQTAARIVRARELAEKEQARLAKQRERQKPKAPTHGPSDTQN